MKSIFMIINKNQKSLSLGWRSEQDQQTNNKSQMHILGICL